MILLSFGRLNPCAEGGLKKHTETKWCIVQAEIISQSSDIF